MKVLKGKSVAESVYERITEEVRHFTKKPHLSVVLVGEDPASQTYVKSKERKCKELGLSGETIHLSSDISKEKMFEVLDRLNKEPKVHGILVQLPLPKHLNAREVIDRIDPLKDVDGLHPENIGLFVNSRPRFIPCTPLGVLEMLKYYQIPISGKKAVVLGRSDIVGKPMAQLLLSENATVTICHSKTSSIEYECQQADILVAAVGVPLFVKSSMVKDGAIVIDVGIHRVEGKLVGDVDYLEVSKKASAISPVPGGVGPMTIAMLMQNLVTAFKLQQKSATL